MSYAAKKAKAAKQAAKGSVEEEVDFEDLAEQLGVGVMHVQELHATFKIFSKGDYEIDSQCLGKLCRALGVNPTEEEEQDMINEMDDDVSGAIQFTEFSRFFIGKMKSNDVEMMKYFGGTGEEEIKMVMDAMVPGASSSGITKDALKITMTKAGFKLSDEELDFMIKAADLNGDGKVYAAEFRRMLTNGTCKWPLA